MTRRMTTATTTQPLGNVAICLLSDKRNASMRFVGY